MADLCQDDFEVKFPLIIGTYPIESTTKQKDDSTQQPPKRLLDFRVGETTRSDSALENAFRPKYPVCKNCPFPGPSNVDVVVREIKPMKM